MTEPHDLAAWLDRVTAAEQRHGFIPEVICPSCGATWGQVAAYQCDGPFDAPHPRVRTVPLAAALVAAVRAALDLHRPESGSYGDTVCTACIGSNEENLSWPCPTVAVLAAATETRQP